MRPEDIIDGLGQVSDHMVQDALNLKKSPWRSLKWGSLAACILCGVTLLGVCAVKLLNSDRQQSLDIPEPSVSPVVSEMPQDSSEEAKPETTPGATPEMQTINPEDSLGNVLDYQVVVREDAIYFVDPYIGLMSMDPETKETKTILPNGPCSLAESDGSLYCLNQATGQVSLVENGDVTTVAMLENMGPGYPFLQGVSNGYVCWMQDWTYYVQPLASDTSTVLIGQEDSGGELGACTVYQGYFYCVKTLKGSLIRVSLTAGETEPLWSPEEGDPAAFEQVLRLTSTADVSIIPDRSLQNLYLEAVQTIDDVRHYVYYYLDMSTDELRKLTTLDDGSVTMSSWDGKLYLIHTTGLDVDGTETTLISVDPATGETQVVLTAEQTATFGSCTGWAVGNDGLYYTRYDDQPGIYYYSFSTGESTLVYQSSGLYGSLVMEPDFYWQQGDFSDAGEWYEHFNVVKEYCDLTYTETGVYYVDPAEGVYRYIPEEERLELLVSGKACRILKCDEGLYATCSDSGEVYEIQDGTAQLLLTLEKEQQIAVKPIAVKDGKLYWNYYVTDLSTGETETDAIFRLKKSQPQILHDGKIYCLGENGEIGYVDPTGGTENYQPLTGALGTRDDQWEVKFFDDCIIALQRDSNSSKYQVYRISYEDGSAKWLATVMGSSINILNLEGDTLYLEPMNELTPIWVQGINVNTGETETVMYGETLQDATEVELWQGVCYYVKRSYDYDTGYATEFGTYDLETETNTTYVPGDSMVSE